MNTKLIDIPSTILAILLAIGGVVLLFFGKIDYVELTFFIVTAVGLVGYNAALKAPSPAQAQQLSTQADQLAAHDTQLQTQQQQLAQVSQLAVQAANTATQVQAQVQAPAPQQTPVQGMVNLQTQPQFMQPLPQPIQMVDYGRHWGDSQVVPVP